MSSNILDQYQGLTCVRFPILSPIEEGNVHSGAPPPWLQTDDGKISTENTAFHQSGVPLSRSKVRRLQKLRNPKRVGAAWADKRRAELEREKAGNCIQRGDKGDKGWLPSFGRVWQSGSRTETRKEFEAEKWPGKGPEASKHEVPNVEEWPKKGPEILECGTPTTEKGLGRSWEAPKCEVPKSVQPYVSKRQRLEKASMQPSN